MERKRILLTLFPPQPDEKTDWGWKYDTESLCYVLSRLADNDKTADCAICLDAVQTNSISGAPCSHVYHYDCLMEWMVQNHDHCPTCRAALWDEVAYQMLGKSCLQR